MPTVGRELGDSVGTSLGDAVGKVVSAFVVGVDDGESVGGSVST